MLPTMMRLPTSLRRRRLLGRSQEAVCESGGEHLADLLRCDMLVIAALVIVWDVSGGRWLEQPSESSQVDGWFQGRPCRPTLRLCATAMPKAEAILWDERKLIASASVNMIKVQLTKSTQIWP
jgi:hypothetical protein